MIRLALGRSMKTVNGCYDNCFRARYEKHDMNDTVFTHTQDQLKELARNVLAFAREQGATDASVEISEGSGLSVSVRRGKIETIEQNRDKGIGVTVYSGQRRGNASTSDFSEASLKATVEAAWNIARFTAEDPAAGLPDADLLEMNPRDLRLCYPWQVDAEEAEDVAEDRTGHGVEHLLDRIVDRDRHHLDAVGQDDGESDAAELGARLRAVGPVPDAARHTALDAPLLRDVGKRAVADRGDQAAERIATVETLRPVAQIVDLGRDTRENGRLGRRRFRDLSGADRGYGRQRGRPRDRTMLPPLLPVLASSDLLRSLKSAAPQPGHPSHPLLPDRPS